VNNPGQRAERAKLFSWKLTHLLPVVVRVLRVVVVLSWTGGRFPARFNSSGLGFGAGVGRASVLSLLRVNGSSSSFEYTTSMAVTRSNSDSAVL
jgi:hypothetical protein